MRQIPQQYNMKYYQSTVQATNIKWNIKAVQASEECILQLSPEMPQCFYRAESTEEGQ